MVIGVLLAVFIGGVGTDSASAYSCASPGSTTVFSNSYGRYFKKIGHSRSVPERTYQVYYSCSYRYGKKFRLAESGFDGEDKYGFYRITSRYAAYAYRPSCGACQEITSYVMVQDMISGKHIKTSVATGKVAPNSTDNRTLYSLTLKANGSVAFGGGEYHFTNSKRVFTHKVISAYDRKGLRTLDNSLAVKLTSLRRNSSTLSWLHGDTRRYATLY